MICRRSFESSAESFSVLFVRVSDKMISFLLYERHETSLYSLHYSGLIAPLLSSLHKSLSFASLISFAFRFTDFPNWSCEETTGSHVQDIGKACRELDVSLHCWIPPELDWRTFYDCVWLQNARSIEHQFLRWRTLYEIENELVGLDKAEKTGLLLFWKRWKPMRKDRLFASKDTLRCQYTNECAYFLLSITV